MALDDLLGTDIAHKSDLLVTPGGDLDTITGLANVKEALFRRLMTSPGTLAHRPNYGVGLKNYQNAPNSLSVQRELAGKIQEQFEQDPRVEGVLGVSVGYSDDNPGLVTLTVRVKIVGYSEQAMEFTPFGEGL